MGRARPRVFVDGRWLGETGLGRYVDNLMAAMVELDHGMSFTVGVLGSAAYRPSWLESPNVETVECRSRWFTVREQVEMPRLVGRTGADLCHFTNFNVPLAASTPFVTTVHDLTLLDHPTGDSVSYRLRARAMSLVLRRTLRRGSLVVVPSEYVAGEIRRRFAVGGDVVVTHEAPTDLGIPDPSISDAIPSPFVLAVGQAYPHKNIERLLDAFGRLEPGASTPALVLVGPTGRRADALRETTGKHGLEDRVVILGRVTDGELAALYDAADLYVCPSLSEGFGLPGLEAMTFGTPVAATQATCLPEVYSDAAAWFDGTDPADIAATLERLLRDRDELDRLSRSGRERAATFTWERTAEATLEAYRRVLAAQ